MIRSKIENYFFFIFLMIVWCVLQLLLSSLSFVKTLLLMMCVCYVDDSDEVVVAGINIQQFSTSLLSSPSPTFLGHGIHDKTVRQSLI